MMQGADSIHDIDPSTLTPAMRQYQQYKQQYPDAVLFFRMGDFYECFYEDARTVARVLGVALTSRSKGENPVPMAGVPFHAVDSYLHRMIAAGYKVAICEQMENPKEAKGLIKREVTRLVTPGTLTEEAMLDGREENFLAAVVIDESANRRTGESAKPDNSIADSPPRPLAVSTSSPVAIAWCELSTGKFATFTGSWPACADELARLRPREILHAETSDHRPPQWAAELAAQLNAALSRAAWQLDAHHAAQTLKSHYNVLTFAGFGYDNERDPALRAAGAIVAYLHDTQKSALEHLQPPRSFQQQNHLLIDPTSLRSLEVLRTLRSNTADGSLVAAIDRTSTPMGARLLRNWLCYPLRDIAEITRRQDAIAQLVENEQLLGQLRTTLSDCSDIERITARICCRRAAPRDLVALARSLETLTAAAQLLEKSEFRIQNSEFTPTPWQDLIALTPSAASLAKEIRSAIADDPAPHLRDGNVIRDSFCPELDRLRSLSKDSRTFLAEYQSKLIARSNIPTLKVGYNKVFGFYIEVTNTHAEKIPADFIRKQTVKNAERYITPELKQYESDILTAQERSVALEQDLFDQTRNSLAAKSEALRQLALAASTLDVYAGLAHLARTRRYCRPQITAGKHLLITDGRHPVVEQSLGEKFVPNDTMFGLPIAHCPLPIEENATPPQIGNRQSAIGNPSTLHLITGPNMAGKSTYIRQVALLVLLAQAGSFIPAKSASIGIVDRIFTRVGASDDLAAGQSTFMVEMTETANILHHATENSLVILDEIGRGTSTLDGLALAWAIAEFLADTAKSRTLFATHYHELTELAETSPGGAVANYNVLVREWEDQVVFMHRIVPGQADKSYGVHVARLAGVPRSVVTRARQLMTQLVVHIGKSPSNRPRAAAANIAPQISMFDTLDQQALSQLRALDLDRMSPMQAWESLKTLKAMLHEKKPL